MLNCEINFSSKVLQRHVNVTVLLPEERAANKELAVLYLLPGFGGDNSIWGRRVPVERIFEHANMAIVIPEGYNSFYINWKHGLQYEEFYATELFEKIIEIFNVSRKREENYIAGLSMGGYGAMRIGLKYEERFSIIGSFSGAVNLLKVDASRVSEDTKRMQVAMFGENAPYYGTDLDVETLVRKITRPMSIYQSCGLSDYLYENNQSIIDTFKQAQVLYTYEEWEGVHDYVFWEQSLIKFANFIVKNKQSQ